jgi:mRNA interferase RelE/StbE
MLQNLSLRGGTTKQSQELGDYVIASFRFASFAMTIGHFITWSTLSDRVLEKIQNLALEPRPDGVVKLKGLDNEYRIRAGDYRVRYEVDDENQLVQILQCKHRKDVYRKKGLK